jgi:transposase
MSSDKEIIHELRQEIIELKSIIVQLLAEIKDLKHPKNSKNSSVAPSNDQNRVLKNQSLRGSSGKKVGGQNGHKGTTLEMVENPDTIVDHEPDFCYSCGNTLQDAQCEFIGRRQIIDIPPIKPEYTEHRIYKKTCSCGASCQANFPTNINFPISYGTNVQATIAYLHTRQYLPFARMSEFFADFCNLPISQGTICNLLEKFTQKALPVYEIIAQKLHQEKVVATDETGIKINGKKGWFWAWQNRFLTYIVFSTNRGFATIEDHFSKGFPNAVLLHDCWASHFKTICKTHQICIAHLLRELIFFEEKYESNWATNFKRMLYNALEIKKELTPNEYQNPIKARDEILKELQILLLTCVPKNQKELFAFHKRMTKYKDYIFTFLHYYDVPSDNNGSERAIRNVKVKQKISGHFKTENGAQIFAVTRSVTDTCIKNGQNVLDAFKTIANLQAE